MEGFFTKKETDSVSRPDGKTYSCASCGLYKNCKSPRMAPFGNFKKGILNIGEAPGEVEDIKGKPFQGKTGTLLKHTYSKLGVDLFEDCLNINAVHCRPTDENGNNRAPTNYEIECCRRTTLKVIRDYKPKVIVLLGNSAVYSLIGHRWKRDLGGITKWRGFTIPDQDFQAWICPTFHPSFIERSEDGGAEETVWLQDLRQAFEKLQVSSFPVHKEPDVRIIDDLSVLSKIKGNVAFDYETTGLKPHASGHRIVCTSVAVDYDTCFVFMMPKTKQELKPFIEMLKDPKVGKIAQNMKFEHAWSLVRLKTEVQNWVWDTMIASHLIDNRPGVTGLKFQVYVQFGIVDYSSEIAPYLQATESNNGNSLNKINILIDRPGGKNKLLKYCGLDAVYEYRLAMKQQSEINLPF